MVLVPGVKSFRLRFMSSAQVRVHGFGTCSLVFRGCMAPTCSSFVRLVKRRSRHNLWPTFSGLRLRRAEGHGASTPKAERNVQLNHDGMPKPERHEFRAVRKHGCRVMPAKGMQSS